MIVTLVCGFCVLGLLPLDFVVYIFVLLRFGCLCFLSVWMLCGLFAFALFGLFDLIVIVFGWCLLCCL